MATIFRPPIFVTIYPRSKAKDSWEINLRVLYSPNPAVPFNQLDWPSPVKAKAKAVGEAVSASAPLFTPNPPGPFNQNDWRNPVLARPSQKSDAPTYFIPPKPFTEVNWTIVAAPRRAAIVDTVQLLLPLYAPPAMPFSGLTETRTMQRQLVKSDIIINLLPLQAAPVVLPFSLTDWSTVASRRSPAKVDLIERSLPLLAPNPDRPFIDPIMANLNASKRAAAIVDAFVNLLPVQNPTPPPTGITFEWIIRARRRGRR